MTSDDSAVTASARSLFLTRNLRVQTSEETYFDHDVGAVRFPSWDADTYWGGFALSPAMLAQWATRGSKVLDLASGLAVFATEAACLDLHVDCADLVIADGHKTFDRVKEALSGCYVEQLEFLRCLSRHGGNDRYAMAEATQTLLEKLWQSRDKTVSRYPHPSGRRFRADATSLRALADDSYDAVLCGWLLVHLSEEDEQRVLSAAARVTRPGGQVRVRAGVGDIMVERFRRWHGMSPSEERTRLAGTAVSIDAASHNDLLVLNVEP